MGALAVSGSEITDLARANALAWLTTQQGGSTDGETVPAGFGVWRAGTNLITRGQCDSVGSSWLPLGAGSTAAVDATVAAPLSPQSVKVTVPSTIAFGGQARTAAGIAAAAGVIGVGGCWFKGVAGQTYKCLVGWINTDASSTQGVSSATINATGNWQWIVAPPVAVAAGKTGDKLNFEVFTATARAESFWLAHAMLEAGVDNVSPYIATSQGATATRAACRDQAPVALIDETQCWAAFRIAYGFASTVTRTSNAYLLDWRDDANNLLGLWLDTSNKWNAGREVGGVGASAQSAAQVFAADAQATVVFACDAGNVKVSVNGGAFVSVANTSIPTLAAALFDIASQAATAHLNGRVLWAAFGKGALANADAAALAALSSSSPSVAAFSPSAIWPAVTSAYETPPVLDVAPVAA
jgi:hypothetical protein